MTKYYDLCVNTTNDDTLSTAKHLGWDGICFAESFEKSSDLKKFLNKVSTIQKSSDIEIFTGAIISKDIQETARKSLEHVDLILVNGISEEINREASECYEVDILLPSGKYPGKDMMNQKNSGIDHVMAGFMAERGIALGINFSEILNSYGSLRSLNIARIKQNVMLARKYKIPIAITSCAKNKFDLRGPREFMSIGKFLGLSDDEAKSAISKNPQEILQKSKDRKNPNIILKCLEVVDWGKQKPKQKRMYGWY